MEAHRLDGLARSLSAAPARRRVSHAMAGLTLSGMLVPLFGLAETEANLHAILPTPHRAPAMPTAIAIVTHLQAVDQRFAPKAPTREI